MPPLICTGDSPGGGSQSQEGVVEACHRTGSASVLQVHSPTPSLLGKHAGCGAGVYQHYRLCSGSHFSGITKIASGNGNEGSWGNSPASPWEFSLNDSWD